MAVNPQSQRPLAAIAFTVAGMVTLATSDAIVKHLTSVYAVAQILWIRYALYASYGSWVAYSEAGLNGFRSARPWLQIARGSVLVCANMVFLFAFSQLPLADVHAVLAAAPLFITCASVLVLGEVVGYRRWVAISIGFVGVLIILRPGIGVFEPITLVPVLGTLLYSSYQILTKVVSRHDPQGTTQFFTGMSGFLWFSLMVPFVWITPAPDAWFWLAMTAVAGTLAHIFIIKGLHLAPASTVQPFSYSMLVAASILGFLVFDDMPDTPTIVGALIVVASGLYAFHRESVVASKG